MTTTVCVDCKEPLVGGKMTERGMICADCAKQPNDPRVDPRRLRASRNDRLSRQRQRDVRQDKPV